MPATDPRRCLAVLVAATCLAGAVAAHEGDDPGHASRQQPEAAPPAAWAQAMLRQRSHDGELLRVRLAAAALVVEGRVAAVTGYDGGKLQAGRLAVERVRRGPSDLTGVRVAEILGARRPPAWLAEGVDVFAVLEPAPAYSYLDAHLPQAPDASPGYYHQAAAVFRNVSEDAADALAAWLELGTSSPAAGSRAAALAMLAAGAPALVPHALAELARVPAPAVLAPEERTAIARVMRESLPGKAGLARRLGEWRAQDTAGLLRMIPADDAVTRARVWAARARLGAPPHDELEAAAGAGEAALRAAAAWGYGHAGGDAALAALRRALGDPDADVRRVATAALGETGDPRAPPLLAMALDSPAQAQRVVAARALARFEGEASAAVLARTAVAAEHAGARAYAAKLLVARLGVTAGPVRELAARADDPAVRRILTEGVVDRSALHEHGHGPALGPGPENLPPSRR